MLKLLGKYMPETKKEKKERLQAEAENKSKDKKGEKPINIKFGLNHITTLIEEKKAKLVVIAHDVDPIEMVLHVPALCRRMGVPYAFLKGKARLGKLVHQKTTTCVALTAVKKEDDGDLTKLQDLFRNEFNNNTKLIKEWGGGIMGVKTEHKLAKRRKLHEIEMAKRANM